MTLDRLKTLVLARLDELTRNGAEIPRDAPHIRDFCAGIPGFADAQLRVISSIIPKRKRFTIFHNPTVDSEIPDGGPPAYPSSVRCEMPGDFRSAIRVSRADGRDARQYTAWADDKTLEITAPGEYTVDYLAFYQPIDDASDDTAVDVPPEAEPALIAGVAAMCVQHENEILYTQLFRENQGLLANLKPKPSPVPDRALNRLF